MISFKKNKSLFLISFLLLPAFLAAEEPKVYERIPPEKALLTSPYFFLIDDFNMGKLINKRDSFWIFEAHAKEAGTLQLVKKDARNQTRGFSLRATFSLEKGESVRFYSGLNRMDVSRAEFLVFKCQRELQKKGQEQTQRIRISLTDWTRRKVVQDITSFCPLDDKQWQDVFLPMSLFKTVDLDQLMEIEFILLNNGEKATGSLSVDELAFYGEEVFFESHRDNIVGFPDVRHAKERQAKVKAEKNDYKFLREIAKDIWKYFENARDKQNHLIVDHLRMGRNRLIADYTSPTNIAMDLMGHVAAWKMDFLNKNEAVEQIDKILKTVEGLKKHEGLLYNFYDTKKRNVTREYISSVDNGWFYISLVVLRQAFPKEFSMRATRLLEACNFHDFLDPETNQMIVGFEVPRESFGKYHYGMLVTEARAMSYFAIGKGDVPSFHWCFLYRTVPEIWDWQNQEPKGKIVSPKGIEYFQGYYEKNGVKFVPSWGGSLFEFLMPTLVINEKKLAPKGLGLNNERATKLQIDYALLEKKYPLWGISPSSTSSGRRWDYGEYGVKELGSKGYPDKNVVTPHASFLALETLPQEAIKNIRKYLEYEIYGEYGFYDSFNLRTNEINPQYLALDQGMILLAICNYLHKGFIQELFHRDPIGRNAEHLLDEEFFVD